MRTAPKEVLAVVFSDLHLRATAPTARAHEGDWFKIQKWYLDQIKYIGQVFKTTDFILAGDVFDSWRPSPEVINFAISHLPHVYAVPGQHDLPHHRYEDVQRTAYWTLVEARVLTDLKPGKPRHLCGDVLLWGVPWNHEIPTPDRKKFVHNIAVIHRFCWAEGHSHPGAKTEDHVTEQWQKLKQVGFSCAVFGDNHSGFSFRRQVLNCGTPIRRRSDEWDYQPKVGLLLKDMKLETIDLDTSIDRTGPDYDTGVVPDGEEKQELVGLIHALKQGMSSLDFRDAIEHHTRTADLRPGTKRLIAKLLEGT